VKFNINNVGDKKQIGDSFQYFIQTQILSVSVNSVLKNVPFGRAEFVAEMRQYLNDVVEVFGAAPKQPIIIYGAVDELRTSLQDEIYG
jgi:hypothetical protein